MELVLTDSSSESIAKAIERNLYCLYMDVASLGKKKMHLSESVKWVMAKPTWPNMIFDGNFEIEVIDKALTKILAQVNLRNAPGAWVIGPSTRPINLGSYLERYNFVKRKTWSGMAIWLTEIKKNFSKMPLFDIQIVNDAEMLKSWAKVITLGLFGNEESNTTYVSELFNNLYSHTKFKLFVGLYDGKPVGSSMLYFAGGVAGIYHISTLPEYRHQGIGTQMSLAPLQLAEKLGYRYGVLQASEMGEPVYRKIGFKEYYSFGIYGWTGGQ